MPPGSVASCQAGFRRASRGVAAPGDEEVSLQFNYSFTHMDTFRDGSSKTSLDDIKANTRYTTLPVSMDMFKSP